MTSARAVPRAVTWRDRLYLRRLWWRHAYTFNWAHKPLCDRFQANVLRFGSVRICRSCSLLYASVLVTGLCLFLFNTSPSMLLVLLYSLLGPVLVLSHPPLYDRFNRLGKDTLRVVAGILGAVMVTALFAGAFWLTLPALGVFLLSYRFSLKAYGRAKRNACEGCPELGTGDVCSGFRHQLPHIRAYEMAATEHLYGTR